MARESEGPAEATAARCIRSLLAERWIQGQLVDPPWRREPGGHWAGAPHRVWDELGQRRQLAWNTPIEDHAPKVLRRAWRRGMPIVFMRFSIATAPEIEQFRDDPRGLAERVRQIVEG